MLCEELMTRDPKCCRPSDSALRVARMMKIEDVGSLPVCSDDGKRLVGIVTDRDLCLEMRGPARISLTLENAGKPAFNRSAETAEASINLRRSNG